MSESVARPRIASFVILRKDGKIAFVLRQNTGWMNGFYGLPSGKVEPDESYSSAAIREVKEEVGIDVSLNNLQFVHVMHRHENDGADWVDVFFEATKYNGEVVNAEPHMHAEVAWFDPHNLPKNIIPPVRAAIGYIEDGITYGEYGWN